jgi:NitT/TauT family transport system substrate-binding protein
MAQARFSGRAVVIAILAWASAAQAQQLEKLKVATTFLGLWDTSQPSFCQQRGDFRQAGLDVDVVSTRGGSENVQAVTAGGMDIGYSPGSNSVLAAYMHGGKIKIISSEFIGQNDSFFYVPTESPIRTIDDLRGKTVAYPRPGGAGEAILIGLKAERHIDFKSVAGGGMDAIFTMTMTRQIDVGYAVPPSQLDAVEKGQIRVLFAGDDVKSLSTITGRFVIASDALLKDRPGVAERFLRTLDGCIDWSYAHRDEAATQFAALNKIDPGVADKAIGFYKRSTLAFGPIAGQNEVIQQAVDGKFIDAPPTQAQLNDAIDILYTTPK